MSDMASGPPLSNAFEPLVRQFMARAARTPDVVALVVYPAGATQCASTITWGAWANASRAIAAQLVQHGVARGDRVAVMAGNRPLWPIVDVAMQMIGAIGVGIATTSTEAQVATLLRDSGATRAFASGSAHARTLQRASESVSTRLPLVIDADGGTQADELTWGQWLQEGAHALASNAGVRDQLASRLDAIALDDVTALIYTSGSTGVPKGACISHRYLSASALSIGQVLALTDDDRVLSFLPFSHAAERVFGQCTRITCGLTTALIEDPGDLFAVARDFEPTLFGGLPRIFERLYEAADVARRSGADPRAAIVERIGTRCRVATSGGATMPTEIAKALADLGLLILGAYGQTEHLCVAMNHATSHRFDAVGFPMPGTTVRVSDDGELLVAKSQLTFSGYWSDPDGTRAAFTDDGVWLRTGDQATIDDDGMLHITGRVKELIALSTGRKVAPIPIEAELVSSPFIAHAICYGEGRKYLVALVSLRRAVVEAWAAGNHIAESWPALVAHPLVRAQVQAVVDRVNTALARPDRIQRVVITEREFSVEGGELTPTHKVVRRVVSDRFAGMLDAAYDGMAV